MLIRLVSIIIAWIDPLSRAMAPLMDGLIRRGLLRGGVSEKRVTLNQVSINYYHLKPIAPPTRTPGRWKERSGASRSGSTPIVLIHGLGDNALTWAFVLNPLAREHEVYAVDLPGYGFSGLPAGCEYATLDELRDLMIIFLREIVGQPALVVGNSLGAWLAVRVAQHAPTMVRELVLINAGGAVLQGRPSWEPFRDVVAMPDLRTARQAIQQVIGLIPAPLLYLAQRSIQERFQRQVVRAFVAAASESDFLVADDLLQLQVPVALLWGLKDRFLPAGSLEFFRENLPNATIRLLRYCGHLPQRERPFTVARFICARAAAQNHIEKGSHRKTFFFLFTMIKLGLMQLADWPLARAHRNSSVSRLPYHGE